MSNPTRILRTKYIYETIDQFLKLHEQSCLKTDRNAIFVDLIKLIRKMEKNGVTHFPNFYQLLNKTAKLKPKEIRAVVNELRKNFSHIFLSAKTRNNMNLSDMNVIISKEVLNAPLNVREFIITYVSNRGTSSQLFEEKLDELIKSIEDQKNAISHSQPNGNHTLTSEADQSENTQNRENIEYTSLSVIPWDFDNDNDNYNPNIEEFF